MATDQGFDHELEDDDDCIADDSTECDCSACVAREEVFWAEQEGRPIDRDVEDYLEPDDGEDRP